LATYRGWSTVPRIALLLLLVVFLTVGGALWFDQLGLMSAREFFSPVVDPVLRVFGVRPPEEVFPDDPQLLEDIRAARRGEALELREEELAQRARELEEQEEEFDRRLQELEEREALLEEREESFERQVREREDREANIRRISNTLSAMPPGDAAAILADYDNQLLIEVLMITDEIAEEEDELSLSSVWLNHLPPDRVAEIQRQMTQHPDR